MEVNKDEAERCRDIAANSLRLGQHERAAKFFRKSLSMYPLPGVDALLAQAERLVANEGSQSKETTNNNTSSSDSSNGNSSSNRRPSTPSVSSQTTTGVGGRSFTPQQIEIVKEILKAKEGGSGAHYRVLRVNRNATEAEIKKAYRKMALKLHPDKNSAPHADEAFKAVGLAYGTLSDPQKRTIYDRYGDEDPDNRGGGMRPGGPGGGGMQFRPGQEVSPEEIFNMFFGGGGGGGGGMRGGPGLHFHTNFGGQPGMRRQQQQQRQQRGRGQGQPRQQQQQEASPWQNLTQLLPFLVILVLSFLNMSGDSGSSASTFSNGEGRYFSLTQKDLFIHPLQTELTQVKDIPYYVNKKFMKTYFRDRYQLAQVERMVEGAYENYLVKECNSQRKYRRNLISEADKKPTPEEQEKAKRIALEFDLKRCTELNDLFPLRSGKQRR